MFARKPEGYRPSGTCNMSRIDNAVLAQDDAPHAHAHAHPFQLIPKPLFT